MARPKIVYDFEASAVKLVSEVEKSRKSLQGMSADLKLIKFDSIVNLGTRAIQTAKQIYSLMESTSNLGSEIQRNARAFDMSTNEYQKWLYVAKAADVEQEQFMLGLRVLTKNLGDMSKGTGEAKDAFERLGLSSADATKLMSDLLPDIIKKLGEINNTTEQNALTMDLFGSRSGLAIANMVREGKNIDEIIQKFKELGSGIDEISLEKLANSEQAFKDFSFTMQKVKAEVLAPLVTVFAELLKAVLDIKKALLDNDWESLWGRMSPKDIGKPLKGGIGSMYLGYEESKRGYEEYEKSLGGLPGKKIVSPGLLGGKPAKPEEERPHGMEWVVNAIFLPDGSVTTIEEFQKGVDQFIESEERMGEAFLLRADLITSTEKMKELQAGITDEVKETAKAYNITAEELLRIREGIEGGVKDNAHFIDSLKETNEFAKEFGRTLDSSITQNLTNIIKKGGNFKDAMENIFDSMADSFISATVRMITQWAIFGNIKNETEKGAGWGTTGQTGYGGLIGGIGSLVSGIGGILKLQHGTDYVPQTGLALLHKGEAIIPAERNREGEDKGQRTNVTNINIQTPDTQTMEQWIKRNSKMFIDVSIDNIRRGGELGKAVRGA